MNRNLSFVCVVLCGVALSSAGVPIGGDSTRTAEGNAAASTILTVVTFPADSTQGPPDSAREMRVGIKVTEERPIPPYTAATLIRTSRIDVVQNGLTEYPIVPDSVVRGQVPLAAFVLSGNYLLDLNKAGFRGETRNLRILGGGTVTRTIELLSLEYLNQQHDRWMSRAWIAAGVSVLAGMSTLYFNERVNVNMNQYNDAMTVSDAVDYRNAVNANRTGYRISTAFVIVSATVALVSWIVAQTYR
jgi:hypothetical protein